ncbi:tetratricopeptide repeat protein [Marinitenerispora sediminis]|uniref:Transcriptional regulator n=1 Tax=Marinitenerispora sediminis TaxID=1931232 RepID=A0A368T9Q0_9ACTN|nr:tetratricopeptide repeat protein [Marinitenerispora sediminis]RCV58136.1 transcriptional regulator [Marinitenerispora sediminis]RCV58758.1 transcriptional regulator [Marinitenerispora sediminis]RCV61409.1 transcriptional regulator [Marinitenerispora sediminis]
MPRSPNAKLAALLSEAGLTYDALARAVNRVGAEAGLDLRYDRTSVAHWLSGARPRGQVPDVITEAIGRRLRRPLTPTDTGFVAAPPPSDIGLEWHGDVATSLTELGRADMDVSRRAVLRHSVYSLAALVAIPNWQEIADRAEHARRKSHMGRVGPGEVDAVSAMAEAFSTVDDRFGGGHARSSVAAYIANDVAIWLRADAAPDTRRALHAAAADLVYLAGFMAWDDDAHGLAERYYLQALRLAAEADAPLTYATVLRGMSIQASDLGHHNEALHLVEAAESAAKDAPPRMWAFLAGQRAVAQAALGDRRSAVASLSEAERHLESATSQVEPFGSYHHAALAFQEAHLRAHLGDVHGAVTAMTASNRRRPEDERRSRALSTALLGDYQFRAGHLEAACQTWHAFLDDYPYLTAGRADAALARLRSSVQRHSGNAAAAALFRRADDLVAA